MYLDQRLYLAEGVLAKVDRAGMACGIEVRSPFLDDRLVSLAAEIPLMGKLWGRRKGILRALARGMLPRKIAERPKKGFGAPVGEWLRGPLIDILGNLPERAESWIDPELTAKVVREHLDGEKDNRRRIWSAVTLCDWLERG